MKSHFLSFIISIVISLTLSAQSEDNQLKNAVLAAPEAFKEGATVYGYEADGSIKLLREGSNEMICIGDDPAKDGFNVVAYHQNLEPFMQRGRELKKEGKSFQEIFDIRESEVKSEVLPLPDKTTLFVMTGKLDENGNPTETYLRYVIYIPWATPETTGLPLTPPAAGGPWIMDPGTHRAHIMINPPKND